MSMPNPFQIHVADDGPIPVVELSGEFDLSVSEQAWQTIERVLAPSRQGIVLDMTGVTFVDSRGLSVLARMLRELDDAPLTIRGASDRLVHLLEVSGLSEHVTTEAAEQS